MAKTTSKSQKNTTRAKKSTTKSTKKVKTSKSALINSKPQFSRRLQLGLIVFGLGIFAFVGLYMLRLSSAGSPSSPIATKSCGARVENYTYQVPFGQAVWNQPVCELPRYPDAKSTDYANRFIQWGNLLEVESGKEERSGFISAYPGFPKEPTLQDPEGLGFFSREVYYASDATEEKKVTSLSQPSNLDGAKWNSNPIFPRAGYTSNHPNNTIPWNPSWKSSRGSDNEIFILDDRPGAKEGRIYTIWGYNTNNCLLDAIAFPNRVCGASIDVGRDHYGNIIDYRTHEGYVSERGVGLSYYATLTTPEEVEAGEIRHALGVAIPNTSYGKICTKAELNTSAEGKTCGTAVAPASKFEWGGEPRPPVMPEDVVSLYSIDKTIPEGMRFAIDVTDAQIESWINSRPSLKANPRRAETARIFARAVRDYGMIVVDTNGARPSIQMVGGINPQNKEKWTKLAMGPEHKDDILEGLVNKNNLYVVDPPTLTCADGSTSKHYCRWINATYDTVNVDPDEPAPTPTPSPEPEPEQPTTQPAPNPTDPSQPASPTNGTVDKIRPSAPANVKRELVLNLWKFRYDLKISWDASADNVGIKEYIILRNGVEIGRTKNTSFTDSSISADIKYDYTVTAVDTSNNRSEGPARTSAKGSCFFIWCSLQ